jgi:hypothetical protein
MHITATAHTHAHQGTIASAAPTAHAAVKLPL